MIVMLTSMKTIQQRQREFQQQRLSVKRAFVTLLLRGTAFVLVWKAIFAHNLSTSCDTSRIVTLRGVAL